MLRIATNAIVSSLRPKTALHSLRAFSTGGRPRVASRRKAYHAPVSNKSTSVPVEHEPSKTVPAGVTSESTYATAMEAYRVLIAAHESGTADADTLTKLQSEYDMALTTYAHVLDEENRAALAANPSMRPYESTNQEQASIENFQYLYSQISANSLESHEYPVILMNTFESYGKIEVLLTEFYDVSDVYRKLIMISHAIGEKFNIRCSIHMFSGKMDPFHRTVVLLPLSTEDQIDKIMHLEKCKVQIDFNSNVSDIEAILFSGARLDLPLCIELEKSSLEMFALGFDKARKDMLEFDHCLRAVPEIIPATEWQDTRYIFNIVSWPRVLDTAPIDETLLSNYHQSNRTEWFDEDGVRFKIHPETHVRMYS